MKNSFNNNAGPKEIIDFMGKTLSNTNNQQDALETIALALLPKLKENRAELDLKARNIPVFYDLLMSDVDPAMLSAKITAVTQSDVQAFVDSMDLGGKDPLVRAQKLKSNITSFSEDDYVTLTLALDGILPPSIKAASDAMSDGRDPETDAREIYRLAQSLSVEDIAAAMTARSKQLDPQQLAAGLHDMLQQCRPERVESFINYINDNMGGAGLGLLVKRFWDFAEETLTAADKGDFLHPANPGKVRAFGRTLNDTLTAIDEGLKQAGFTLPKEVTSYAAQIFNTGKMLRSAAGDKQGAAIKKGATDDITIGKPLQLKKPGFGA